MKMPRIVDMASFGWGLVIISVSLGYIFGAPIGCICIGATLVISSFSFREKE